MRRGALGVAFLSQKGSHFTESSQEEKAKLRALLDPNMSDHLGLVPIWKAGFRFPGLVDLSRKEVAWYRTEMRNKTDGWLSGTEPLRIDDTAHGQPQLTPTPRISRHLLFQSANTDSHREGRGMAMESDEIGGREGVGGINTINWGTVYARAADQDSRGFGNSEILDFELTPYPTWKGSFELF